MTRYATYRFVIIAFLVVLAVSCDSGPPVPMGPGFLYGILVSPNGAEGAVVLRLTGAQIGEIELDGGSVFQETDGNTTRVVVILDEPGSVQFRVYVAERSEPPDVTLVEVADGNNQIRTHLAGYRLEFTPVIDSVSSVVAAAR